MKKSGTWKDLGVVPDSDDEDDDAFDSQNVDAPTETDASHEEEQCQLSKTDTNGHLTQLTGENAPADRQPGVDTRQAASSQIPAFSGDAAEEETSRSYVRLSSSTSSLSSVASSRFSGLDPSAFIGSVLPSGDEEQPIVSDAAIAPLDNAHHEDAPVQEDIDGHEAENRRFRPRTKAQLHPYLIDSARHRNEFRARGLQPLRLAQAQEEERRAAQYLDSQDTEFEPEEDSQNTATRDDSQMVNTVELEDLQDLQLDTPSNAESTLRADPSESTPQAETSNLLSFTTDADEDFPDIPDLVKSLGAPRGLQRHTYGRSHTRANPTRPPNNANLQSPPAASDDIYEVPRSPPTRLFNRSMPLSELPRSPPTRLPRPTPLSELPHRLPSPSDLNLDSQMPTDPRDRQNSVQVVDLPTPITSSASHAMDHTPQAISDDNPFTSSPEIQEIAPTTQRQPRKTNKSLRGVLPASHVRVNQQMVSPQASLPRAAVQNGRGASPAQPQVKRGLAIPRIASRTTDSTPTDPRTGLQFLSDDSDMEDSSNFQGVVRESAGQSQEQSSNGGVQSLAKKVSTRIGSSRQPRQFQRSIQDVMPGFNAPVERLPRFMRIAARSAGSRHALGRLGPARKFVRLDNREDTVDARSILSKWMEQPSRPTAHRPGPTTHQPVRPPLHSLSGSADNNMSRTMPESRDIRTINRQTKIPWAKTKLKPGMSSKSGNSNSRVSRPRKISKRPVRRRAPPAPPVVQTRSAQLEISEAEYRNRDREAAFGYTKSSLDRSYNRYRRGSDADYNIPLARFLAGDSVAAGNASPAPADRARNESQASGGTVRKGRQRKRPPKQLDATAAEYRQPDVPLIAASIETPTHDARTAFTENKLYGLGREDTRYTVDFDAFPLRSGVYFHESTFIGQGKLAKALRTGPPKYDERHRGFAHYKIGEKQMRWSMWDDSVSSEMEECFDWIISRLRDFVLSKKDVDNDVVRCMVFLIEYMQDTLTFESREDFQAFLLRMVTVMQDLTENLEVLAGNLNAGDVLNNLRIMELSTFEVVLIFQTLRTSASHDSSGATQNISNQLEALLQKAVITSVKLLFLVGLSSVRSLYDDLEYLKVREAGIRDDQSPTQAWVMLIHIMQAARIPRVSFWDAVNMQLLANINIESDVRVMERIWYSTFSLLPLVEFDEYGLLTSRSRYQVSFENWAMPQKVAKRLFEFYASDADQSPSFNNYFKAILSRCHHLIQMWGWRRYGLIVGTLFDFFASHTFSPIGSKSYTAPEFITDLDGELSSAVKPEDECFHIFLKIVHSAIKQLRQAGDVKEIRNLVTRLLPNHDLEYQDASAKATGIASLRNHHDLLFTLYWAAPSELRHKVSVMLDLVDQEWSKQETHLRNARNRRR